MFYLNARAPWIAACGAAIAAAALGAGAAAAAGIGPQAAACDRGDRPAMLVRIDGVGRRGGTIRLQAYADPATYFDKGAYVDRVDVATPAAGPIEVCVALPHPGLYAIAVRHDLGGGTFALDNGGGFSGNPDVSPLDLALRRKPDPAAVQVAVKGLTRIAIRLHYLQARL